MVTTRSMRKGGRGSQRSDPLHKLEGGGITKSGKVHDLSARGLDLLQDTFLIGKLIFSLVDIKNKLATLIKALPVSSIG
ncbi:MAG TPA: hypothetical protein VIY47_01250 [Ignavibacteriaceae bacterium]